MYMMLHYSTMEFYYDLLSQPCRAIYVFLKAAGVQFEPKLIELTKGKGNEGTVYS